MKNKIYTSGPHSLYLTVVKLALLLRMSQKNVLNKIYNNTIPHIKQDGFILIEKEYVRKKTNEYAYRYGWSDVFLTVDEFSRLLKMSYKFTLVKTKNSEIPYCKPFGRVLIEKQFALDIIAKCDDSINYEISIEEVKKEWRTNRKMEVPEYTTKERKEQLHKPIDYEFFLSVSDFARLMRTAEKTIRNRIYNDEIPFFKPFGKILITKQDALDFIDNCPCLASETIPNEVTKGKSVIKKQMSERINKSIMRIEQINKPLDYDIFLTVSDYARLMRLSEKTIKNMIYNREIPYYKPFGKILIKRQYALGLIERCTYFTEDDVASEVALDIVRMNREWWKRPHKIKKPKNK